MAATTAASGPDPAALAAKLGPSLEAWTHLVALMQQVAPEAAPIWKFYGEKYGWQLKFESKKKAILYMIPHDLSFGAALALKGEALERLNDSGLPADLVQQIHLGKMLPEGKAARVEVAVMADVMNVERLVRLKLACS